MTYAVDKRESLPCLNVVNGSWREARKRIPRSKDSEGEKGSECKAQSSEGKAQGSKGKAQGSDGKTQGSEDKAQGGNKINTNAWRQCSLPAVNLNNMQLLRPKIDNVALAQELKIGPADNGRFKPNHVRRALGCSSPQSE
ncbi:hypothetical protein MGN70_005002 [Eutypa lata]|nr:hypothetical protein MGN70_005002 [Eutypa lata]